MATPTLTEIQALETSMRSGTRRVSYNGKTIEYNSYAEMKQAHTDMVREYNEANGVNNVRMHRFSFDKGL